MTAAFASLLGLIIVVVIGVLLFENPFPVGLATVRVRRK
jgi:hypothetical protein